MNVDICLLVFRVTWMLVGEGERAGERFHIVSRRGNIEIQKRAQKVIIFKAACLVVLHGVRVGQGGFVMACPQLILNSLSA